MERKTPTIKGIFVKSHIKVLRDKKGEAGVKELEAQLGKSVDFKNSDDIPVSEEVKIIELVLALISDSPIPPQELAFEAGRLHFKNFATTPLAKIIFSMFRTNFKLMMMSAPNIAGHVFQGVVFTAQDLGEKSVKVTMENNNYAIDHFRGLFQEWMEYSGYRGNIKAHETSQGTYEYVMRWE